MATTTGKAARKQYGTRAAARRAKERRHHGKRFGSLPVSASRGNAETFGGKSRERAR